MVQFLASKTLLVWFNFFGCSILLSSDIYQKTNVIWGMELVYKYFPNDFYVKYISNVSGGIKLATYLS